MDPQNKISDLEARLQRMTDLVRHQRGALHDTGLISDAEYSDLLLHEGAVARLEGYDAAVASRVAEETLPWRHEAATARERLRQVTMLCTLLRTYVKAMGPLHAPDCPGDDTCTCEYALVLDAVEELCRLPDQPMPPGDPAVFLAPKEIDQAAGLKDGKAEIAAIVLPIQLAYMPGRPHNHLYVRHADHESPVTQEGERVGTYANLLDGGVACQIGTGPHYCEYRIGPSDIFAAVMAAHSRIFPLPPEGEDPKGPAQKEGN